jgi:uncharacterized membrane protein YfcA
MTILLFVLTICFGVVVGILSGMFGIGGGTLMIPILNLAFRLPILASTATSLFVIAPTSISGAWRHIRQGTADVRAATAIGLSGAVASAFSSFMSDRLPDIAILAVALGVILYSASSVLRGVLKKGSGEQKVARGGTEAKAKTESDAKIDAETETKAAADAAARIKTEAPASANRFTTKRSQMAAFICLGVFAGLVAGVAGVGGGFIIVPISIAYFGYAFKKASGTSLLAIAFIAVPGIITHAILGHIWYLNGIALMIGAIPGANLGARLITKVPERAARLVFAGLLMVSAALLIINRIFPGG